MFSLFQVSISYNISGFKPGMWEKMKFTYAVATAHHLMGLASECNKFHSIS
jgi:hypothetical protein